MGATLPAPPGDFEAAVDEFLLQLEADGRSEHTVCQYRRHLRLLGLWLASEGGGVGLRGIGNQLVARFVASDTARLRSDGLRKRPTSENALRTSLRTFFGYLHAAGAIPENPARLLRRALCEPRKSRALDPDEETRLLAALAEGQSEADRRDRVLFTLMLRTGLRIGAALALRAQDVDLDRGEITVRTNKGAREDVVLMPRSVREILEKFLEGHPGGPFFRGARARPLGVRQANRRLRGWFERAGIQLRGTHVLRHTFAQRLYERTGDVLLVKEALGHRSVTSTVVYARTNRVRLRAALE